MSKIYENCILKDNNFNQICSNDEINSARVTLTSGNESLYDSLEGINNEKQNSDYQKVARN